MRGFLSNRVAVLTSGTRLQWARIAAQAINSSNSNTAIDRDLEILRRMQSVLTSDTKAPTGFGPEANLEGPLLLRQRAAKTALRPRRPLHAVGHAAEPQRLWVYTSVNFQVDDATDRLVALLRRAKQAGYDAAVVTDYKFGKLDGRIQRYYRNLRRTREAAGEIGIELIPCVMPIGYSNSILQNNPRGGFCRQRGGPVEEVSHTAASRCAPVRMYRRFAVAERLFSD